ncbi:TauD/TfdA family dioxygenase [Streptomyces rubiginosohelvolus]|uniref:TauD/TfdA family dioxygenase n=1 Tax=Streptomyces rubiginosohelvolus TaxID=67362 RepID=UPI0035DDB895
MPSTTRTAPLPDLERAPGRPPLLPADPGGDAPGWIASHRHALRAAVTEHGAVLVRGLDLRDASGTAAVRDALGALPLAERETFAAREPYGDGVLSATPWPSNQPMCMHHELSYALEFPGLMLFACLRAPERGGATGVADAAAVLEALPNELTARFEREGWLLTRSFNGEIGAGPAEAFGSDDRIEIEAYCRANAIRTAWRPDGELRTEQRRAAVLRHPADGRRCWFNQVAFLNEWTLAPEIRAYLIEEYGADGLPFNTRYGNGEPLSEDVVRLINEVYEDHAERRPWETGDLLIVDNLRAAHSREPYEGPREVVVAPAAPMAPADLPTRFTRTEMSAS